MAALPLRAGRDVVSLLHRDSGRPSAAGIDPLRPDLPIHGQRRESHARLRGQRPSWRPGPAAVPDDEPPGQNVEPGGRRRLGCPPRRRRGLRPGRHRRRRHQHRRVSRSGQPRRRAARARAVPDREQPLCLFHAHQRPVSLPAAFRPGDRLRNRRTDDRRHRSLGSVFGGGRSARHDARRAGAGAAGMYDLAAARPRRLRQGALRARVAHGRVAAGRSAAADSGEGAGGLRAVRRGHGLDRGGRRRGNPRVAGQGDGCGPAAAAGRRLARLRRQRPLRQQRRRGFAGRSVGGRAVRGSSRLRPGASRTATRSAWPWNTFWPAIRRPFWPAWTSASTARLSKRARG